MPLFIFFIAMTFIQLSAMEFQPLGFKAASMGGAGVVSVRNQMAIYYNPALLARTKHDESSTLGVSTQFRDNGLYAKSKTLDQVKFFDSMRRIAKNAPNRPNSVHDINVLKDGTVTINTMDDEAMQSQTSAYLLLQYGELGFGFIVSGEGVSKANVSTKHSALIFQQGNDYYTFNPQNNTYAPSNLHAYQSTSLEYATKTGLTHVAAHGIYIAEIPLGYAQWFELPYGILEIGAAIKPMFGTTYDQTYRIDFNKDDDNLFRDEMTTTVGLGIDMGWAFSPSSIKNFTLGMVGKNLTSPLFRTHQGKIQLHPMVRIGFAYQPTDTIELATDLDLSHNRAGGENVRYVGGGIGWTAHNWLTVRGGVMTNLLSKKESMTYTGGIKIGPDVFHLNLALQLSSRHSRHERTSFPRYLGGTAAIASSW